MIIISRNKLDFIQEEPFKAFLYLSIPIIGLLIFNELYSIFDTYFLAQLGNSVVIAMGYMGNIFYFINRSGKGIGRGSQSIITRALGERDYERANEVAVSGILIIILLCVIFQLMMMFTLPYALNFIENKSSIPVIITYMSCLSMFMFPILLSEYMTEILNAEGDSKQATYIMMIGSILNVILDYLFICVLNMGVIGASLGTSLAYVGTLIIFFYEYIINDEVIIKINLRQYKFNFAIFKEIVLNSIPIILDSFLVTLFGLITVAFLGWLVHPIMVVAYNLMVKFECVMTIPSTGFSRACNIVSGHLWGAKRFDVVKKSLKRSIIMSLLFSTIICVVLSLTMDFFAGFFTPNKGIWSEMFVILPWIFLDTVCMSFMYNINQVLIALGYSRFAFYSVASRVITMLAFVILLGFILNLGGNGVFATLIISGVIQIIISYRLLNGLLNKADNGVENTDSAI